MFDLTFFFPSYQNSAFKQQFRYCLLCFASSGSQTLVCWKYLRGHPPQNWKHSLLLNFSILRWTNASCVTWTLVFNLVWFQVRIKFTNNGYIANHYTSQAAQFKEKSGYSIYSKSKLGLKLLKSVFGWYNFMLVISCLILIQS